MEDCPRARPARLRAGPKGAAFAACELALRFAPIKLLALAQERAIRDVAREVQRDGMLIAGTRASSDKPLSLLLTNRTPRAGNAEARGVRLDGMATEAGQALAPRSLL